MNEIVIGPYTNFVSSLTLDTRWTTSNGIRSEVILRCEILHGVASKTEGLENRENNILYEILVNQVKVMYSHSFKEIKTFFDAF